MSRQVPLDRALSDKDRTYLRQLGSAGEHLERRIDAEFAPDAEALAEFERANRKYLASMNGVGATASETDALLSENERLKAEVEALKAAVAAAGTGSTGPSYTGWTKAQLEAEVDRVNGEDPTAALEKGKVAEMVTALSQYFAE